MTPQNFSLKRRNYKIYISAPGAGLFINYHKKIRKSHGSSILFLFFQGEKKIPSDLEDVRNNEALMTDSLPPTHTTHMHTHT